MRFHHLLAAGAASATLLVALPALAQTKTVIVEQPQTTQPQPETETRVVKTQDSNGGGELAGAATGAVAGAVVGGPVGAAVGGAVGLVAGAAVSPPNTTVEYVRSHPVQPVQFQQDVTVGTELPQTVELQQIPDYKYEYVYANGQPVLVDPNSRKVVYIVKQD
ncbi:DUF1236 domain-containing protein [Jiella sp. M17.18]|uniref:DUF1236 domain-containing protein n=1 Tax=Jiella sp. M17.18 TaxID=3234247 RepID=UPI0034DEBB08